MITSLAMEEYVKIYLASPLGFSPENDTYRMKVRQKLKSLGCTILDPWDVAEFRLEIESAFGLENYRERVERFRDISSRIGRCNEDIIRAADAIFAVLDGAEVDSGTASEVGFASALGKMCYGLRTDLRDSGDFLGVPINLQVLHFIQRTGGRLFRTVDEIAF